MLDYINYRIINICPGVIITLMCNTACTNILAVLLLSAPRSVLFLVTSKSEGHFEHNPGFGKSDNYNKATTKTLTIGDRLRDWVMFTPSESLFQQYYCGYTAA